MTFKLSESRSSIPAQMDKNVHSEPKKLQTSALLPVMSKDPRTPPPVSLGLLAGGMSRRMGVNKAFLLNSKGETLLSYQLKRLSPHFTRTCVLSGPVSAPEWLKSQNEWPGIAFLPDPLEYQGQGPVAGLVTALEHSPTEWLALVAIDQPAWSIELGSLLEPQDAPSFQALLFSDSSGHPQWLGGFYHRNLLSSARSYLASGKKSIGGFVKNASHQILRPPPRLQDCMVGMNTPHEAECLGFHKASEKRL